LQYDDDGISVYFPDIDEAYTCSKTTEEAIKDAEEVLKLSLKSRIKDDEKIPAPTELREIETENNQYTTLVSVTLENKIKYDKKTLTIPHDLNLAAEEAGFNFSQILQAALKNKLMKTKL
jgi:antitoxin HicB